MTAFNIKNLDTIYYEINCNPIVETKSESNQIVILIRTKTYRTKIGFY